MQEEKKEVKRIRQKVMDKLGSLCLWVPIAILIAFPMQLIAMLENPTKIIETLGITDFINLNEDPPIVNSENLPKLSELKGNYVCDYYLVRLRIVIGDEALEDVSLDYSTLGKVIILLAICILIILPILSKVFLGDCHYIILWHGEEDYFYVSLPEVSELETPLLINREFHMSVSKKEIHINDGTTEITLGYDQEAEKLLKKLQKH